MTETCTLPRKAQLYDTPHPQVGDMQRAEIRSLDLAGCNVLYIVVALNEFDQQRRDKIGHRFETWPDAIRMIMEREVDDWTKRNEGKVIKGITQGVEGDACVLALHWKVK